MAEKVMREFDIKDKPIKVYGVPFYEEHKLLERIPKEIRNRLTMVEKLGKRVPGARVCFKTNSKTFKIRITFETLSFDVGMSIYACQAANVLIGERKNAFFAGLVNPPDYETKTFEKTFNKSDKMEDITVFLPRNEPICDVRIFIEADAAIEEPTPYKYGPVLFYGSSITEGGCCCRVSGAYNAVLSNRLDFDYYNFGFSGSAKGEIEIADYINTIDMTAFVMDYDHNAPDVAHLKKTHEPFFKRIREKNPDLPVIIMSRPNFYENDTSRERRDVILQTYTNAVKSGDKNVYFIDGQTFFGEEDRQLCTIDTLHPTDLGFYRMAQVIEPVMKKALGIE